MGKLALLVLDVQKGIMDERLFQFEQVKKNIEILLATARKNQVEVIHVRHDDGPGSGFSLGDEDFEIFSEFEPIGQEKVFDKKVNSAFHKSTGLVSYLEEREIDEIIMVGLLTDYCMDATVKSGFEHGFQMIIPEYTNSSFNNSLIGNETIYRYFNEIIWPNRYAQTVSMEKAVSRLEKH